MDDNIILDVAKISIGICLGAIMIIGILDYTDQLSWNEEVTENSTDGNDIVFIDYEEDYTAQINILYGGDYFKDYIKTEVCVKSECADIIDIKINNSNNDSLSVYFKCSELIIFNCITEGVCITNNIFLINSSTECILIFPNFGNNVDFYNEYKNKTI